jgi:hypothetical protein
MQMNGNGTGADQIDALLAEDLALKAEIAALDFDAKSQISTLQLKREDIKAQLQGLGEGAMDRWYFQEYRREFAVNDRREEKRRQRRAAALERDEAVAALRARANPDALAKMRERIAGVKENGR